MGVSCSLPSVDLELASLAHFLKQTFLCFQVPTARTTAIQMGPGLPHSGIPACTHRHCVLASLLACVLMGSAFFRNQGPVGGGKDTEMRDPWLSLQRAPVYWGR